MQLEKQNYPDLQTFPYIDTLLSMNISLSSISLVLCFAYRSTSYYPTLIITRQCFSPIKKTGAVTNKLSFRELPPRHVNIHLFLSSIRCSTAS